MLETVQGDCIAANKKPPRSELSRSSEGEKHCVVTGKRKGNISDGKEPRGTGEEEQSSGEGENHTQQGHSRAGSSRYRRLRLGHLKMPLAVCENGLMFLPGICVTFKWHLQKTLALVRRVNCGVEARCTRAGQVRDLRGRGKHGTDSWRLAPDQGSSDEAPAVRGAAGWDGLALSDRRHPIATSTCQPSAPRRGVGLHCCFPRAQAD